MFPGKKKHRDHGPAMGHLYDLEEPQVSGESSYQADKVEETILWL